MSSHQTFVMLCMVLSMLVYQLSASFAKYLFAVLDPTSVTVLRLTFAALVVCLMLRSWRIWSKLKLIQWRDMLGYSLSLGLMNLLFYHALVRLPQGVAVGLEFVGPLGLALFAIQRKTDGIWVLCAIVGVALFMPWSDKYADLSLLGIVLALGAGLCWASYIFFGQRVVRQSLGIHSLTIAIALSAILFMPVGLAYNAAGILNPSHWIAALGLAILATAIPYALDMYCLKYMSRLSYGTLSSLSPALGALTGLLFLNEHLSVIQWVALLCIMLASVGVTLRNYSKPQEQQVLELDKKAKLEQI